MTKTIKIDDYRTAKLADSILDQIYDFTGRFIAYPDEHSHVAHVLWIAHTHRMDLWDSTPRLAFLSPEPASGKTRALEITALLVRDPEEAMNVSASYLFRSLGAARNEDGETQYIALPVLLYDEIDTVFGPKANEHEDVRGLINAGHRKRKYVGRAVVVGKTVQLEKFEAYCAVAMAGIGHLPDTILTRSVVIRMKRRAPGEKVEPYRPRLHDAEGYALRDRLVVWASQLDDVPWPSLPDGIEDRAADVWEPLIAVADDVGRNWPERARAAAVALVAARQQEPDTTSLGIRLLSDLRRLFGDRERMTTTAIIDGLVNDPEAPWGDLRGKPLDTRRLTRMLKEYGVERDKWREGAATVRGYSAGALRGEWERYVPASAEESATSATSATADSETEPDVAGVADVADNQPKAEKPTGSNTCRGCDTPLPGGYSRCAPCAQASAQTATR